MAMGYFGHLVEPTSRSKSLLDVVVLVVNIMGLLSAETHDLVFDNKTILLWKTIEQGGDVVSL